MSRLNINEIPSVHSFAYNRIEFAVEGLVALGAVTAITGAAGVGKTTLITALADHVSRGQPFCGRECKQRPVLYLDRQNTHPVIKERFIRLGIYRDGVDFALKILGQDAPWPDDSDLQAWVDSCDLKPMVIIDPSVPFECATFRVSMLAMRELANRGAAVVLCPDKGAPSLEARESLDFLALIDAGFFLTNTGDMPLGRLRMKAFKACFTVDPEIIFNYAAGSFTGDDKLTALLKENPRITDSKFEKLTHELGFNRAQARKFLEDEAAAGRVRREKCGPTTRNTYTFYHQVQLF